MQAAARAAGLRRARVEEYAVDVGVRSATELVDYRLGQAHHADWLAGIPRPRRRELKATLAAAIEPLMEPYRPVVIVVAARVG